jgi:hypothetical protein
MVKLIGFDTETVIQNRVHEFYSFQIYTEDFKEKNNRFERNISVYSENSFELLDFFTNKFNRAWFVCFNLAFDGLVVARILKDSDYDVKAVLAGSRMIRLTVTHGKSKWIFCDLRNILPIGNLEKVGEMLKFPKLEKPEYLGKRAPKTQDEKLYFRKYAMRDAEICYKAAKMINQEYKTWRTTAAGLAIRVYKRDFCSVKKFRGYESTVNDKLRLAYHGGRTECFIRGMNHVPEQTYDINSLYPYVMDIKQYPNVSLPFRNKSDVNLDYEGIAHVIVSCEHPYPPICVKRKFPDGTEKLVFPNGKYEGWFTYPELRTIEEHNLGKIYKVFETYEWQQSFNPFSKYVKHFYDLKEKATLTDSPKKTMYKINLNSLYGKLGEHGACSLLVFDGENVKEIITLDAKTSWYHSVPLAAYITAYARLENWQYLRECKPETMFYTDTDSFHTATDLNRYCSNKLGKLKLEKTAKIADACYIRAKFYMINDEIKLKGFALNEKPSVLMTAIYRNDFSRQEHRILKALEAQRLKQIPLTDCYITKKFSVESDGKRNYDRDLSAQDLLFTHALSTPLEI